MNRLVEKFVSYCPVIYIKREKKKENMYKSASIVKLPIKNIGTNTKWGYDFYMF